MHLSQRLTGTRTTSFAWLSLLLLVVGCALDWLTEPLWVRFGVRATALEYFGGALALAGYWSLWLLLPISAFRPENRFYLAGDCSLRAKRFGLILGILAVVHAWLIVAIWMMLRTGWR